MNWLKSNYVWVTNGELQRAAETSVSMLLALLIVDGLDGGIDFTSWQWLIAPATASALALLAFVKGKLPAKTGD
jgi:hypothetical protein